MTEGKRVELLHDRLAWLAKMTRDHDKPIEPKVLKPHQLGWLRRPELDHGDIEVWEQPDGKLLAWPKGRRLELHHIRLKGRGP